MKHTRPRRTAKVTPGSIARSLACVALGINSVSAGFIDMDTPLDKRTTTSLIDGTEYHLVSSSIFFFSIGSGFLSLSHLILFSYVAGHVG